MAWVILRQWADEREQVVNYRNLADALGMRELPSRAVDKRFARVIPPMIAAGWIERRRDGANRMHYRALAPAEGRWAVLRRAHDLPLLETGVLHPKTGQRLTVTVAHLVDFARWQLACGRRGWTATSTTALANQWGVSRRTVEMRRDGLNEAGILHVTRRAGHTDLVWLSELHDPRWMVPSQPVEQPAHPEASPARLAENGGAGHLTERGTLAENGGPGLAENGGRPSQEAGGPYKEDLTDDLSDEDLTDLGGASATPLSSLTRKLGDAEPQAAPRSTTGLKVGAPGRQLVASRLLAGQPFLAAADRRWRSGMLATIVRALDRGLDPEHLARALQRVVEAGEVELHCEVVRTAVRQAWADQLAGMCAECGADPGQHPARCPSRATEADAAGEDEAEIRRLILGSLAEAQWPAGGARPAGHVADASQPAAIPRADPLQPYLDLAVALEPDAAPEVVAEWLAGQIAGRLVEVDVDDVPGRRRALDRSAAWWAGQVPVEQHQAIDLATAQLHFALSTPARRAS